MNHVRVVGGALLFIAGFMICSFLTSGYPVRYPFSFNDNAVLSPSDSISIDDIELYEDKLVINQEGLMYAKIENTHSMEPVLNHVSTSIEQKPTTPDDLAVGDIISYRLEFSDKIIIHRIAAIGIDNEGWFAITKGDNNQEADSEKVRFNQIEGKVVGIIY